MLIQTLICTFFLFTYSPVTPTFYYPQYDMSHYCLSDIDNYIQLTDIDGGSSLFLDSSMDKAVCQAIRQCFVVIASPISQGIVIRPLHINLNDSIGQLRISQLNLFTNKMNEIFILNGSTVDHLPPTHSEPLPGDNQTFIMIRFEPLTSQATWKDVDFKILFTAFIRMYTRDDDNPIDPCPAPWHFDCGSGACIRRSLRCDAIANCANSYDEHNCGTSEHEIYLIIAICIFFLAIVFGLIWYSDKKDSFEIEVPRPIEVKTESSSSST